MKYINGVSNRTLEASAAINHQRSTDYPLFPRELKSLPNWVVWRLETRTNGRKERKATKIPYDAKSGKKAKSNDFRTWSSFETACTVAHQQALPSIKAPIYNGIGYVFSPSDNYLGTDLDHCRNPETGEIKPWAQRTIDKLNSYTEISPSGTGVHIYTKARLPGNTGRRKGNIEFYDQGRYFTVTGHHLEGTPLEIHERQAEIDELYQAFFEDQPIDNLEENTMMATSSDLTPAPLDMFELTRRAQNDSKFQALYAGNIAGYESHSEADLALCCKLAFYTQGDFFSIDKFFRISSLFRPKWDERHGQRTYGDMTIIKALQVQRDYYTPAVDQPSKPKKSAKTTTKKATPKEDTPVILNNNDIFHLTDTGNAERFAQRYGQDVRYCTLWKKWLVWDGYRWKKDDTNQVLRLSKDTVRHIYQEATQAKDDKLRQEIAKHALRSEASNKRIDMLKMAQAEDHIPILPDQLDTHPWLLNVQNGTLDLRTNELYPHNQDDYQTYLLNVPYDPKARCPLWIKYLGDITRHDTSLMDYLQKVLGYCLTGNVTEQCLFFLYGQGHNGKTTFVETVQALMSEYSINTSINTLLAKNYQGVPNDIASLKGARVVTASEVPEGKRLNEPLVKDLTGGDTISARFMHSEFFNFKPQFKLIMFGNHKPIIHGTDEGIWRRMRLIPFTVTIPFEERDGNLGEKLINELPGILAWAVEGCRLWQRYGLGIPEIIRKATASYRDEMDAVGAFISECCIIDRRAKTTAKELYTCYLKWCEDNGERPVAQRRFGMSLIERGFENARGTGGAFIWFNIGLLKIGE